MKRNSAERLSTAADEFAATTSTATYSREDEFVRSAAPAAVPAQAADFGDPHVVSGYVLWTLTKGTSTAQARQWATPTGIEFQLQIWTGARVEGEEDLCWVQVFAAEDAAAQAASIKKLQLESAGWMEDLDASSM